jgi:hypothetical protein
MLEYAYFKKVEVGLRLTLIAFYFISGCTRGVRVLLSLRWYAVRGRRRWVVHLEVNSLLVSKVLKNITRLIN